MKSGVVALVFGVQLITVCTAQVDVKADIEAVRRSQGANSAEAAAIVIARRIDVLDQAVNALPTLDEIVGALPTAEQTAKAVTRALDRRAKLERDQQQREAALRATWADAEEMMRRRGFGYYYDYDRGLIVPEGMPVGSDDDTIIKTLVRANDFPVREAGDESLGTLSLPAEIQRERLRVERGRIDEAQSRAAQRPSRGGTIVVAGKKVIVPGQTLAGPEMVRKGSDGETPPTGFRWLYPLRSEDKRIVKSDAPGLSMGQRRALEQESMRRAVERHPELADRSRVTYQKFETWLRSRGVERDYEAMFSFTVWPELAADEFFRQSPP